MFSRKPITPRRIANWIIVILLILLALVIWSRTTIVFANPVDVKVSWDPDTTDCGDVCGSLGASRADGYVLPSGVDAGTYILFTDREFLENDCSFPFANTFKRSTLTAGGLIYTDRTYTMASIPAEFIGYNSIMTPNDSRTDTDATGYVDFALSSGSTLYVGFDTRFTTIPNWLNSFTKTGKQITTSRTEQTFDIYERKYNNCFIPWQSIEFFSRTEDGEYDYTTPLYTLSQSYVDGKSTPVNAVIQPEYENFVVSKLYFVLKACAMVSTEKICSVDSDEVSLEMDMTRPDKTILSMNKTDTDYVFVWTDTGTRTWKYQLQYSFRDPLTNRGGYTVIRTVEAPGLTVSVPIEEIQNLLGDNEKMWFTMVSITKPLIYSRWTDADVEIEKAVAVQISPVKGLNVTAD